MCNNREIKHKPGSDALKCMTQVWHVWCVAAGIQDVDSKEPEAVAAYMASNGAAAAPAEAAGARR
jgi:hypothetical protein